MTTIHDEILVSENNNRYSIFPIQYPDIWKAYCDHKACFWVASEIDFAADLQQWKTELTDQERYFVEMILGFFANSDSVVVEHLIHNAIKSITVPEARCFYGFQTAIENIHAETYSLLIETFVQCPKRKDELFHAIERIPAIKEKGEGIEMDYKKRRRWERSRKEIIYIWLSRRSFLQFLFLCNFLVTKPK